MRMVVIAAVLLASFMLCGCALFPYGAPAPGIDPTRANPDDVIIGKPIGQTTPTQTTPVQTTPTQTTPVQTQNNTPVIGSNTTVGNESLNASMINASVVGNASAGNGTINTNGTAQNESQILLNETETSAKAQGTIKMLFLDVGMGDATLVKTADYTMLIDTGLAQNAQNLSDTLKELGVDEIDALVISSWSEQKTGGLDAILKRFAVYEVWVSKELPSSFFALDAMEILQKREAFVVNPKAGDAIVHGVLEIEVLNPQESEYANYAEANSIVLKINMGKFCAFLPSDLTQETEAPIVGKINSQCAVYKWRKNGEGRPTPSIVYDKIDPKEVVISVGANKLGLPSNTTLQRILISGANLHRTDKVGSIYVNASSDGIYSINASMNSTQVVKWWKN